MKAESILLAAAIAVSTAVGCGMKLNYPGRQDNNGNSDGSRDQTVVTPKENKTWAIDYLGRANRIDSFEVTNVPDDVTYIVSVVNREQYVQYGEDPLLNFMEGELGYVLGLEAAGSECQYFFQGGSPVTVEYDALRHGNWYAFIIGVDINNKLTGEYAYKYFTVKEETATDEYNKWLGKWRVTDNQYTYDLTVTKKEANYIYNVSGWETFPPELNNGHYTSVDEDIETFFDEGRMFFTSQFIRFIENGNADLMLLGVIDYHGAQHTPGYVLIPDEELDVAYASLTNDTNAKLRTCDQIETDVDGEVYVDNFCGLKFVRVYWNENVFSPYNEDDVFLSFRLDSPAKMTKVSNSTASVRKVSAAETGKALRGKVHREKSRKVSKAIRL